jgi:hypothetical protein
LQDFDVEVIGMDDCGGRMPHPDGKVERGQHRRKSQNLMVSNKEFSPKIVSVSSFDTLPHSLRKEELY